jgi:Arc/MetJ-type ribon-helix-helix transcriptional regulator
MKVSKTVTIDKVLLDWVEKKIQEKEFGSLSHALEKGLTLLKKQSETQTVS